MGGGMGADGTSVLSSSFADICADDGVWKLCCVRDSLMCIICAPVCDSESVGVLLGLLLLKWLSDEPTNTWEANVRQTCTHIVVINHLINLPECVAVALVIYFELGLCLLLLSNQFNTSRTAWGFFFCSCLLILEFISNRAHASGIPCKTQNVDVFIYVTTTA